MPGFGLGPVGGFAAGSSYLVGSGGLARVVNGVVSRGGVPSSKIDDTTGDYELDEFGNEVAMSDAGQRVYLLLKTSYGSIAADRKFGLQKPRKLGPNAPREVEAFVRAALAPAVDDGSIKFVSVEVDTIDSRLCALVRWLDRSSGASRTTPFPLAG